MKKYIIFVFIASALLFSFKLYSLTFSVKTTKVSVTSTVTTLPTTALVGRNYISVQNISDTFVYVGAIDVSDTNGYVLLPYSTWKRDYDHTVLVYGRVQGGTKTVIVEEGK